MKFLSVFVFFLFNSNVFANSPSNLSFEKAEEMKISVSTWPGLSEKEQIPHKESLSCTPFEIFVPPVNEKHPEFKRIIFSFELIKDNKVFLIGNLTSSFTAQPTGIAVGCLPLDSESMINVTFSYNPDSGLTLSRPAYTINNFTAFVKSAYNKQLKQDK